jgi:DNA polymerase I-like protein with 3'-5' exonuclease and polymerase domains
LLPSFVSNPDPSVYLSDNYVVLDFETTNVEKGTALNEDNRLVLAEWFHKGRWHYVYGGELDMGKLVHACNESDFLVAHNAKFELQWLDRCGFDIGSKPVWCTYVAEWVIGGNRWQHAALSLDACAARRGMGQKDSVVSDMIKNGVCPSDIPRSLLMRYCKQDVKLTLDVFRHQLTSIMSDTPRLLPIVFTRCLATPVLADIEKNGLHLDADRVEAEYAKYLEQWTDVMRELDEMTGGINPRSPIQVAEFVYGELGFEEKKDKQGKPIRNAANKRFPDGAPKVDKGTLESLSAKTKKQKRFIELKKKQGKLSAALDKNLAMFLGAVREHDGMIFAQLQQGTTVSHRLSSAGRTTYYKMFDGTKGCQFQNLPRIFKPLFSPRYEGWLFGEADGAQLEFRVAGHLGDEDIIRQELRDGYDVHSFTRQVISDVGGKPITRTQAKAHTFKPLYGGRSGTKAERAYYEAFGEKYSSLKWAQEKWCMIVSEDKMLETEWGMRFYWPNARMEGDYLNVKTNVYNMPVQSFATADIIPIGMVYFWHRTRDAQMLMVNTVHDSIEVEFPPEERELFEKVAVQSLTEDVYKYLNKVYDVQFSAPLGVGMLIGNHWGEPLEGEDEIKVQVEVPHYE